MAEAYRRFKATSFARANIGDFREKDDDKGTLVPDGRTTTVAARGHLVLARARTYDNEGMQLRQTRRAQSERGDMVEVPRMSGAPCGSASGICFG